MNQVELNKIHAANVPSCQAIITEVHIDDTVTLQGVCQFDVLANETFQQLKAVNQAPEVLAEIEHITGVVEQTSDSPYDCAVIAGACGRKAGDSCSTQWRVASEFTL